jgi:hypothetical protein
MKRDASPKAKGAQIHELLSKPVITVPEAGSILRLSRNGAYDAAKRGDFETVQLGRLLRVPTRGAKFRRLLGIDGE